MPTQTPKVGDTVFVKDPKYAGTYVVTKVDSQKKVADVKSTKGVVVLHRDVPWDLISPLDASQNAPRVVREATENK